ncbi:MAG: alpha/beta fold hydrolase [Deltaproteobacteria bacterium]|nr:alpha/beta fold hydrolase [Deltaproteobacteria bacterium]
MIDTLLARGEHLARIEANRAVLRFVNGIEWLIRDPSKLVGRTPYEVIYQRDKLAVRRYNLPGRPTRPRHCVPILLVPPLIVKPFIFDLYPGRSLAAFLLERGFCVYLVDFGEPDSADAYVTLDDYVLDWIPAAAGSVKRDAGTGEISLLGYCMGGLFSLMHTAVNRDHSVRNIVTIGAPVDMHKMGLFAWAAQLGGGQVEFLGRQLGNIPGGLSSAVFRLLTPMKNVTRYADLFMNMWDHEYMNGFDAMNQWVSQFIAYPQGAFLQFVHDFMRRNKLVRGKMKFGGKVADLRRIKAALLVFAGRTDQIAPAAAVRAVLAAVGSTDTTFRLAPGGHMGVFAGASAPEHVWQPASEWLAARSQPVVSPARNRRRSPSNATA